eukprot:scaffold49_cov409-Prasinococcus_capsulatus_cf.AAC.33
MRARGSEPQRHTLHILEYTLINYSRIHIPRALRAGGEERTGDCASHCDGLKTWGPPHAIAKRGTSAQTHAHSHGGPRPQGDPDPSAGRQ